MRTSENIQDIAKALVLAQKEIEPARKNAQNPFYKSKYADLGEVIDAVKSPLNNHGIAFLQMCGVGADGGDVVTTMLLHETGQFIATETKIHAIKQDPQEYGKAISYAKRYALQAALGLATEDDDGNSASGKSDQHKAQQKAPAKQTANPEPPKVEIVTDNKVLNDAWTAFQQTHAGKIPNGYVWDFGRFQAAIKGRCKNRLPKADSNVAEVTAFVQANIPPIECWRAPDEAKAAA